MTQKLCICVVFLTVLNTSCAIQSGSDYLKPIPLIIDTDANNELDDQHALAYAFFSQDVFDIRAVTVNATKSGGAIEAHMLEAARVMALCDVKDQIPLIAGANGDYQDIVTDLEKPTFDGSAAVQSIIDQARQSHHQKLVILALGKLTNIALALDKAPDIASRVRVVWLGSNYPDSGEYNLVNDPAAVNSVLSRDVDFEIVTVRYGKPSGSDAVSVTPQYIEQTMPGLGPRVAPVQGRHGNEFSSFGDYSISLFQNIQLFGEPPGRALFDVVAVAIVKNRGFGDDPIVDIGRLEGQNWISHSSSRPTKVWQNFHRKEILRDFFQSLESASNQAR